MKRRDCLKAMAALPLVGVLPIQIDGPLSDSSSSCGREIWVYSGAPPGGDGATPATAVNTLLEAFKMARFGDWVHVCGGHSDSVCRTNDNETLMFWGVSARRCAPVRVAQQRVTILGIDNFSPHS